MDNETIQRLRELFETIRDERRTFANTANRIGNAFLELLYAIRGMAGSFLRKDQDDETNFFVTFLKGVFFGNFTTGMLGTGGAVTIDNDGNSTAEFDFLTIRKAATFRSITILELKHIGGELGITAGAMKVSRVEEYETYYRCYFDTTDGKRRVYQEFIVGDQARCQAFRLQPDSNGVLRSKYYWRLVVGVSTGDNADEGYVDLSKTDCDTGSSVPEAGDEVIQLGYRPEENPLNEEHKERQSAIILSAVANDAPSQKFYQGINSFNLEDKFVKDEGYDSRTGLFHCNIYGDFFVGEKGPTPSNFVKYDSDRNLLEISGRVKMTSGSTLDGATLGNNGIDVIIGQIAGVADGAQERADEAYAEAQNAASAATAAGTAASEAGETAQEAAGSAEAANQTAEQSLQIARNLSTGNGNLLRNSGFTGDYLDENVAPLSNVNQGTEMYSDPFDHWIHQNAEVIISADSASGAAAVLSNGSLSQTLERGVEEGKEYVFSFKGKGTSLQFSVGGFSETVALKSTVDRYNVKFTAASSGTAFAITGSTCTVMELQLIEGNIPFNNWVNHPKDNDKSLAYFQNFTYLLEAIVNGRTDILGGLILSNMIKVGNYRNNQPLTEQDETGGMSGIYTSPDSPFIWGGGSKTKAHYTIAKYAENPLYEPTAAELANDMAQFVVTHGGRVILNDIIARGVIIATSGIFKNITSPHGNFRIDENGFAHLEGGGRIGGFNIQGSGLTNMKQNGEFDTETYVIFRNDEHKMFAGIGNVLPSYTGARATGRFENFDENRLWGIGTNYGLLIGARNADENIAVLLEGGSVARFALRTESISENNKTLSILSGSVVFLNSEAITTKLPAVKSYDNGHSVKLKSLSRSAATIYPSTFDKTITPVGWQNLAWGGSGYTANANACSVRLDYRNPISMALTLKKGYILRFDQWDVNTNTPIESLTDSSHRTSTSNRPADSADRTLDESFLSTTGIVILTVTKISGEAITPSEASAAVGRVETTFNTFIHYNGGDIATPAESSCELYDGIGMELVFHADVITQKDNKHYVGCWAQYKHNW